MEYKLVTSIYVNIAVMIIRDFTSSVAQFKFSCLQRFLAIYTLPN